MKANRVRFNLCRTPGLIPVPGRLAEGIARLMAPSPGEVRKMLVEIRQTMKIPRSLLAAMIGTNAETVRDWESGARVPRGPSRRCVWMLQCLTANQPENLQTALSIVTWGKVKK